MPNEPNVEILYSEANESNDPRFQVCELLRESKIQQTKQPIKDINGSVNAKQS